MNDDDTTTLESFEPFEFPTFFWDEETCQYEEGEPVWIGEQPRTDWQLYGF